MLRVGTDGKLEIGNTLAVVSPSSPIEVINQECIEIARGRLGALGLETEVYLGANSVGERVQEIHHAFTDINVDGLISSVGGYRTNQLLSHLDWDLISENPKPFIGFSDITVLLNAIYAKTGLVTFLGPHFSTFGQVQFDDFTSRSFESVLMNSSPSEIEESDEWTDDLWYIDQQNRKPESNEGGWIIHEGQATGTTIGGNLCSLNLLQGTEYWPAIEHPIALIEEAGSSNMEMFDRDLQSLLHAQKLGGLIIGRFQRDSKISKKTLGESIADKKELKGVPVVANVDIGHTLPTATVPIGGVVELDVGSSGSNIKIVKC